VDYDRVSNTPINAWPISKSPAPLQPTLSTSSSIFADSIWHLAARRHELYCSAARRDPPGGRDGGGTCAAEWWVVWGTVCGIHQLLTGQPLGAPSDGWRLWRSACQIVAASGPRRRLSDFYCSFFHQNPVTFSPSCLGQPRALGFTLFMALPPSFSVSPFPPLTLLP